MLINSAQKMPSIQLRISIEFRNPAHQLSANILASYLLRYLYLPSVSRLVLFARKNSHFIFSVIFHLFSRTFMQLMSALSQFSKHFLLLLYTVWCIFFKSVGSKLAIEVILTNSVLISLSINPCFFFFFFFFFGGGGGGFTPLFYYYHHYYICFASSMFCIRHVYSHLLE